MQPFLVCLYTRKKNTDSGLKNFNLDETRKFKKIKRDDLQ